MQYNFEKMDSILAVVLFGTILTAVNSERHSLSYIYTALSRPVDLPGIHEFTGMGFLDDTMIDYYDSTDRKKIPKQTWMKERLEPEYWTKGTTSRQSKEQWFKVNINILMERMRQANDTKLHVLQWSHGCEVEIDGESKKFVKGTDHYSYDGSDFLSFDDANMRWIAPVAEAVQTKTKWDNVHILNQYTKGYLQKECVDWLEKFMTYGNEQLEKASPPTVHVFTKAARAPGNIHLHCMATGFYPKDVLLEIRKNHKTLDRSDGLEHTDALPNGDGTFQIRKSVEIRKDDKGDFDCYVHHRTLKEPIVKEWDRSTCGECSDKVITATATAVAVTAIVILLVVAAIGFVLYKKGIIGLGNTKKAVDDKETAESAKAFIIKLPEAAEDGSTDSGCDSTETLSSGSKNGSTSGSADEGIDLLGSEATSTSTSGEDPLV